jgi:hypothetical protein
MRSTTFALLGLTAAAGLTLVALFAQPGGPLLSPAPLPHGPASAVAGAEPVEVGDAPKFLGVSGSVAGHRAQSASGQAENTADGGSVHADRAGAIASPQPVSSPPASGGGVGGNGQGEPEETTPPPPAASPPPQALPTPSSVSVDSPAAPETTPPVRSSSHGDKSHGPKGNPPGHSGKAPADDTSHHSAPPTPPTPVADPPPEEEPPAHPGPSDHPGNGHAYGHYK